MAGGLRAYAAVHRAMLAHPFDSSTEHMLVVLLVPASSVSLPGCLGTCVLLGTCMHMTRAGQAWLTASSVSYP
jgi:hypothetical protein